MKLGHISIILLLLAVVCLATAIRDKSSKSPHALKTNRQEDSKFIRLPLKRGESTLKKTTMTELKKVQKTKSQKTKTRTTGDLETRPLPPGRTRLNMSDYIHTDIIIFMQLGTPPQNFSFLFDTGSTDIWVNSIRCSQWECISRPQYSYMDSSTYHTDGVLVADEYGSGECQGIAGYDTVTIGSVTAQGQLIQEIIQEDGIFDDTDFSGIVGFGIPDYSDPSETIGSILLDTLFNQSLISQRQFTLQMTAEVNGSTSEVVIGGLPFSYNDQRIKWYPVTEDLYWAIKPHHIEFGEFKNLCSADYCYLVIDSGTTAITVPTSTYEDIMEQLTVFAYSCQDLSGFPPIKIYLGDDGEDLYELTGEDYMITAVGDNIDVIGTHSPPDEVTDCTLAISNLDFPTNQVYWILGEIFLRKLDAVFDLDNKQIGFANRNIFTR